MDDFLFLIKGTPFLSVWETFSLDGSKASAIATACIQSALKHYIYAEIYFLSRRSGAKVAGEDSGVIGAPCLTFSHDGTVHGSPEGAGIPAGIWGEHSVHVRGRP